MLSGYSEGGPHGLPLLPEGLHTFAEIGALEGGFARAPRQFADRARFEAAR